jgi:shikimate kinase
MCRYLITRNAGTGKSTVIAELRRRGYNAVDGDELNGIHAFLDKQTGTIVDKPGAEGFARFTTVWQPVAFKALLQRNTDIFIGGSVHNQSDFYDLFDEIVCLKLTPEILEHRLAMRSNNPAGSDKKDRDYLLAINDRVNERLEKAGAIMIDSDQPLDKVVDDILGHIDDHPAMAQRKY